MKRIACSLLAATAALLLGCVVTSVHPFYTEKDLVFEPALVDDWIKEVKDGPDEVWKFEKSPTEGYRLTLIEERQATVLETHLFKLQGQLFLDIASMERDYHVIPPHYLLKVSHITPTLRMSELNHDWLKGLVKTNPSVIRHHLVRTGDQPEDSRVVLTADTAELQKFVLKHLETAGAWKDDFELKREASVRKGR
jgi:hypothetical protein